MRHCQSQSVQKRRNIAAPILPTSIELLEFRVLLAGDVAIDARQIQTTTKLTAPLWRLYESAQAGENIQQLASAEHLQIGNSRRVAVTLNAADVNRVAAALRSVGFSVTSSFPSLHFADGVIPIQSLGL